MIFFQDELGAVLLDVCESVPHGILCFFSSYNVMHTQMQRWISNSIWTKITSVKQIFIEPRYGGDLKDIMYEYRQVIEQTSGKRRGKITGALFLAVFRGKVAEGIDFKDNEARCVITVSFYYLDCFNRIEKRKSRTNLQYCCLGWNTICSKERSCD